LKQITMMAPAPSPAAQILLLIIITLKQITMMAPASLAIWNGSLFLRMNALLTR